MTDHIGNGFVECQSDFVAVLFAKANRARKRRDNTPDATQNYWIAQELKPQEKLPARQGSSSEGGIVSNIDGLRPIARGAVRDCHKLWARVYSQAAIAFGVHSRLGCSVVNVHDIAAMPLAA